MNHRDLAFAPLPRPTTVESHLTLRVQVSFLHVYHHTSISVAWWLALYLYPGGDAYFGALINSWIHVMMYSYYTLSLLKIRCPWKKYLTMAQLVQFTTVVLHSICSMVLMRHSFGWKEYLTHFIQDFEMISLFVLFMHFYNKAYAKKKLLKVVDTDGVAAEQASVSTTSSEDASSEDDRDQ